MSLRTSYNDTNKVVNSKLSILYSVDPADEGEYYIVTRKASMKYQYVGMDEDTATACAQAKVAQYTRSYSRLLSSSAQIIPSVVEVYECKSDIACEHQNGDAWNVVINVNEIDVKTALSAPLDPSSLFTSENSRNYDGGNFGDALSVESAEAETILGETVVTVAYTQDIRDFDMSRMTCQKKDSESAAWSNANIETVSASQITFKSSTARIVRLLYGSIESAAKSITR